MLTRLAERSVELRAFDQRAGPVEVPPLTLVLREATRAHRRPEPVSVRLCLRADAVGGEGVRAGREVVEAGAHVHQAMALDALGGRTWQADGGVGKRDIDRAGGFV